MLRLLGAKLRHLRQSLDPPLTQGALAETLGISRYLISNVEAGRKSLSIPLVARLAVLFQVPADWLINDARPVDELRASWPLNTTVERPILRTFAEKLRYQRDCHGLTQLELAQRSDLRSQSYISELEHGIFAPSLQLIAVLARLFDVPADYFIFDDINLDYS